MPFSGKQKESLRNLGNAIRVVRQKKGYSQERLAELSNLHRTYISDVERGERNVSFINLIKISHALEIELIDLLKGIF